MQKIRKITSHIVFKIFIAVAVLVFVVMGFSDYFINRYEPFIAKVGDNKITQRIFLKELERARNAILARDNSKQAVEYVDSKPFKAQILDGLINQMLIEQANQDISIGITRKFLMSKIVKEKKLQDENGKFNYEMFKKLLASYGINEEKYFSFLKNQINSEIIITSFVDATPITLATAMNELKIKKELRVADLVTINSANLKNFEAKFKEEEIKNFYDTNKAKYSIPESRKVSFFKFNNSQLLKNIAVSEDEILKEYKENQAKYQNPETRNFYHLLFDDKKTADEFLAKLEEANKAKDTSPKANFAKLAKELKNKEEKQITITNISNKDLPPEIATETFKTAENQITKPIKSELGFHLFLLNKINPSTPVKFESVKNEIKADLTVKAQEKSLQQIISKIDDATVAGKNLEQIIKEFNLTSKIIATNLDNQGFKGQENKYLNDQKIVDSLFAYKEKQVSKIFELKGEKENNLYIFQIDKITPATVQNIDVVKNSIIADLSNQKLIDEVAKLANKIALEIVAEPLKMAQIAKKYNLKFEQNKSFARYNQNEAEKLAQQSDFSKALFATEVNKSTNAIKNGEKEFHIAMPKKVVVPEISKDEASQFQAQLSNEMKYEISDQYKRYLLKKYPVELDKKNSQEIE
jgi:peptidyl-prolyl cis-trans isomerase D